MTTQEQQLRLVMESIAILEAKESNGTATKVEHMTLDNLWLIVLELEQATGNYCI